VITHEELPSTETREVDEQGDEAWNVDWLQELGSMNFDEEWKAFFHE